MEKNYHLLLYAACFSIFFIQTSVSKKNNSNRLFNDHGRLATNPVSLTELYAAGIMWLGLVPLALLKLPFEVVFIPAIFQANPAPLLFILLLAVFVFTGIKESRQVHAGDSNESPLSKNFLGYYFPLRVIFLCAYELFFRGFLLFDCLKWFGIPMAIAISTGLTVLIHVFNSKKEMWACIPFGIILCGCCCWFHAVWPAVILHIALCTSYEITFIRQFISKLKAIK